MFYMQFLDILGKGKQMKEKERREAVRRRWEVHRRMRYVISVNDPLIHEVQFNVNCQIIS